MIVLWIVLWVLLGIVALVLATLALTLFSPVRYRFALSKDTVDAPYDIAFQLSWLFGLLRLSYADKHLSVRILGMPSRFFPRTIKRAPKRSIPPCPSAKPVDSTPPHPPHHGKIKNLNGARKNILPVVKNILLSDKKSGVAKALKTYILRIVAILKPAKFKASVEFELDDPPETGYILGILEIIKAMTGLDATILGNFEKEMLTFTIHAKDTFLPFSVLLPTLKLILNKDIRRMIKNLRKKDDKNEPNTASELRNTATEH